MDLDFLDGGSASDETAAPAINAEGAASPDQPRDEHGRFASTAPAEPQPQPEPAPVAPAAPQAPVVAEEPAPEPAPQPQAPPAGYVPVAVVEELRQKLRDKEAASAAPPPQAAPAAPPAQPQAPDIPDPFEDPEGYQAYHQEQVQRQVKAATLNMSRMMAVTAHGEDTVNEAMTWAAQRAEVDPTFRQNSWNHHHPVDFAVAAYRQHQLMEKLGSDPDAYVRSRALELGLVDPSTLQPTAAPTPAPAQAPTPPPTPPRSLATAPAAGGAKPGAVPVGPGSAFDATFK